MLMKIDKLIKNLYGGKNIYCLCEVFRHLIELSRFVRLDMKLAILDMKLAIDMKYLYDMKLVILDRKY